MAEVTGYTAAKMKLIEDSTVVDGSVVNGDLVLLTRDGTEINAGSVIGPIGPTGPAGPTSIRVVTSTTRPTGGSLFTGLFIYETDTKYLYVWDGAAWLYRGGTIICTSSTRPTVVFAGLRIYETDTKFLLVYDGAAWISGAKPIAVEHTWAIPGPIAVPSGGVNYIPPMFASVPAGMTKKLRAIRYVVRGGTSVTFNFQRNGVTVTSLSGLSAGTSPVTTQANGGTPVTVADNDTFAPVVTAITGSPDGLSVTAYFDVTS